MSKKDARRVAARRLDELRQLSYATLRDRWLDEPDCEEFADDTGETYQVEIEVFWDDHRHPGGNLRVMVSAGSWLAPPTEHFVVRPDGSFVGES